MSNSSSTGASSRFGVLKHFGCLTSNPLFYHQLFRRLPHWCALRINAKHQVHVFQQQQCLGDRTSLLFACILQVNSNEHCLNMFGRKPSHSGIAMSNKQRYRQPKTLMHCFKSFPPDLWLEFLDCQQAWLVDSTMVVTPSSPPRRVRPVPATILAGFT